MAKTRIFVIFLIVTICLLLVLETGVDARGGRGGGGRSGGGRFGGSRSSRSSRSSSSVRTSSGFRAGGLRWKQAATIGFIYGYASYSTRRMYRRYPDREPSICVNKYDFKRDNGTYYSYFICPKYNEPDSYTYCCGPHDRQRCCSYWQGPLRDEAGTNYRKGRAAGTIIGILLFLAMSICCCYCCCCRKRGEDPSRFESFKQRNFKGDQGGVPMSNFGPQSPDSDGQPDYPVNPGGYQGGYPNGPPGPPPGPPPYGGGYPPQPGYPPQTDPAYPPQPGYPPQPQPGYEYPGPGPAPGPGGPPPSDDPAYPQGPGDGSVPYPITPAMYPEGAPYPTAPYPGAPPPGVPPPGMYPNMPDAPYPGQQNGMPSGPPSAPPPTYSAATLPEKK